MIAPILSKGGAWGGISDDKFIGIENSFQDIKNIEIRETPKGIKLAGGCSQITVTGANFRPRCVVVSSSTGTMFAFGITGYVYKKATGDTAFTEVGNTSLGDITGAIEYNGYIYFAGTSKLGRITLANAETWTTPDYNFGTFWVGSGNHFMLVRNGELYIADGYVIATVDNIGTFDSHPLNLQNQEEIIGLTDAGTTIRIYTRKKQSDEGKVYYWTGVSGVEISQSQAFEGYIQKVLTKNGADYVFTGPAIYYAPFQRQLLKRFPTNIRTYGYPYAKAVINDIIYFGSNDSGVCSWGALNKDYPEVLGNEYIPVQTGAIGDGNATCLWTLNEVLHFSYLKSGVTTCWKKSGYSTLGQIISKRYFGDFMFVKKFSKGMNIAFEPIGGSSNNKIQVYTAENGGSYTLRATIDKNHPTASEGFARFIVNGTWNFIEVKIVLSGDASDTPIVYELLLDYDVQPS